MFDLELLGGGRMGTALLGGLLDAGVVTPAALAVVEPSEQRRSELAVAFPDVAVLAEPVAADGVVVATKPTEVAAALGAAAAAGLNKVLSVAAGIGVDALEAASGGAVPVVRAMPNTPSLVGAGAAAIAAGNHADEADLRWAESLLGAVGTVQRVEESALDAVTGLSGSGPAYVFLVAEALIEAGVAAGLSADTASALVTQTLLGSARLLDESDESPAALRAAVTSPGGTTAAGVAVLEQRAVPDALVAAVLAAAERSRELGA